MCLSHTMAAHYTVDLFKQTRQWPEDFYDFYRIPKAYWRDTAPEGKCDKSPCTRSLLQDDLYTVIQPLGLLCRLYAHLARVSLRCAIGRRRMNIGRGQLSVKCLHTAVPVLYLIDNDGLNARFSRSIL
jgi:hypothetical protein